MSIKNYINNDFKGIGIASVVMFILSLFLLSIVALEGSLAPILLFSFMTITVISFIIILSKEEIQLKSQLFIFFFSLYLIYTLIQHYIFLSFSPKLPFYFPDEPKFYHFSDLAVPYLTGEKNFFELFSNWRLPLHDLPLHPVFSGYIAYFSTLIDGRNSILIQKLLSPFFGGLLLVFLYATIKHQFNDTKFAFNATLAYGLFSAVFMYSTPMLRDIDVALFYMMFFYLFLQKFSYVRFSLLFVVAFLTFYLRVESGMVLYGLLLVYLYLYVRTIESKSIKYIFYILTMVLISFVVMLMYKKVMGKIVSVDETYTSLGVARSSKGSIALLFDKLPFGLSHTAKLLFSQLKPFPFFVAISRPLEAISGLLWPFIFITMLYAVIKKEIRNKIDEKVIYLVMTAIAVLFLMSSGPVVRRMMSVYPMIYMTSLYVFFILPDYQSKRVFSYYMFGIISLNVFYYLLKI